jgi:opine dehydrogenase
MRITILGSGNCGLLAAAYFQQKGADVLCYTRDHQKSDFLNTNPFIVEGAINGEFHLKASSDLGEAIDFAGLILVCLPGNAHRDIFTRVSGHFREGQQVLVLNSNFGAYEARAIMGDEIREKHLAVGETASQPFLGTLLTPGRLRARAVKEAFSLAGLSPGDTKTLAAAIAPYWKKIRAMNNVLETSLSGANPLIHAVLVVFNFTRIENGEEFRILYEAPPKAHAYIEQLDQERQALGRALSIEPVPLLEEMLSFWSGSYDSLPSLFHKHPLYSQSLGPKSLSHRFITEDIPYGIMPMNALGQLAGLDTPYARALEQAACLYLGTNFARERIDFDPVIVKELTRRTV